MFARKPDARMNLANFMRTHLYASLATLKIGCDILFKEEKVKVDTLYGHGGLFKTKGVGQSILAAAWMHRLRSWRQPERAARGAWQCSQLIW